MPISSRKLNPIFHEQMLSFLTLARDIIASESIGLSDKKFNEIHISLDLITENGLKNLGVIEGLLIKMGVLEGRSTQYPVPPDLSKSFPDPLKQSPFYTIEQKMTGESSMTVRAIPKEGVQVSRVYNINPSLLQEALDSHEDSYDDSKDYWVVKKGVDYYFDSNPVHVRNKSAQYFIIFDTTYSLKPRGGKIKYKEIIDLSRSRGLKKISAKSVLRALTGKDANLFKYVKELTRKPAHGLSLFDALQDGKELEFNNKK